MHGVESLKNASKLLVGSIYIKDINSTTARECTVEIKKSVKILQ
jgi:hypothetical protein